MEYVHFLIDFVLHIDVHLAQMVAQYGVWVYAILFAIIFCETGLVVTPFLPGDSLLFVGGALASRDRGIPPEESWYARLRELFPTGEELAELGFRPVATPDNEPARWIWRGRPPVRAAAPAASPDDALARLAAWAGHG